MKRYLLVNLDKHQDDVIATDEVHDNEIRDCAESLTMIIDLEEGIVRLGGDYRRVFNR